MRAFPRRRWSSTALTLALALCAVAAADAASLDADPGEVPFLGENRVAMNKMMTGMDVKPTGDIDRDFTAMMIPHHQGAIDMAQAELRYGHNELLRRMAQEIIVAQQQEIAAMQLAVGQPLPLSVAAPDQPSDLSAPAAPPASMPMMNMQPPQKEP